MTTTMTLGHLDIELILNAWYELKTGNKAKTKLVTERCSIVTATIETIEQLNPNPELLWPSRVK
jgi:hypothetical protein